MSGEETLRVGEVGSRRPDSFEQPRTRPQASCLLSREGSNSIVNQRYGDRSRTSNQCSDYALEFTAVLPLDRAEPVSAAALDQPNSAAAARRVLELADSRLTNQSQRARFHADMSEFQRRAVRDGLPEQERVQFFQQISRLLGTTGDAHIGHLPINTNGRLQLARQLIAHAARPASVDQGNHDTCAAAALEASTLVHHPARVAEIVADVALTGFWRTLGGDKPIEPHASILRPDREAAGAIREGVRSFASQIFQGSVIAAINSGYAQMRPVNRSDSGERILQPAGSAGTAEPFRGLRPYELALVRTMVVGNDHELPVLQRGDRDDNRGVLRIGSRDQLSEVLSRLATERRFPAVVGINPRQAPFGVTAATTGGHWVSITSYDRQRGTVSIDDQYGHKNDLPSVSLDDLYRAIASNTAV